MNFGGIDETVITREEFPLSKARDVLKDENHTYRYRRFGV